MFTPLVGVDYRHHHARAVQAVLWTNRDRAVRNVIHWGIYAAIPNTVDTLVTLILVAGATILDIFAVTDRMCEAAPNMVTMSEGS
ncbi:MAG: hypothetical protein CVU65_18605 [Deltaproteobacteria bacterium HGW-Deltaproteobacteria-22]|nr:MAG: hypothetical protein CVU65_18605 [Deltaproteobacteria bacterium HGW-Deltaproteobacteria-22]